MTLIAEEVVAHIENLDIVIASELKAGASTSKRLIYYPAYDVFSVQVKTDGVEVRSPFLNIHEAVNKYNEVEVKR
jgi:hypothetical protein